MAGIVQTAAPEKKNDGDPIFAADRGSPGWWRAVAARGTPLVARIAPGRARITFIYRSAAPDIDRIYIDVNGVTDHHRPEPQALERVAGTDLWWWQVELPSNWRGSYAFIPVRAEDRSPGGAQGSAGQRAWWSRIAVFAEADPLNRDAPHRSGWGGAASPLHLPDAPDQSAWRVADRADGPPAMPGSFIWHSAIQGKQRTVWHLRTDEPGSPVPAEGLPLVLLLDGANWVRRMPVAPVLVAETRAGRLPPAFYLLVDSIDGEQRAQDLPPNPIFWSAIDQELLPLAHGIAPISKRAAHHIVAGQSFGGLAALYAVFARPDQWGGALAQSPSLWWPDESLPRTAGRQPGAIGTLTRQLLAGSFAPSHAHVFLEVGTREGIMVDVARTMRDALPAAGHTCTYREYEGGHDLLCWRGGLIDGLRQLLPRPTAPSPHKDIPA